MEEQQPTESPRGEVVFALAKGVACIVACAACLFLAVLMIFAKAFFLSTIVKYGFLPLAATLIIVMMAFAKQMNVSLDLIRRIYLGALS